MLCFPILVEMQQWSSRKWESTEHRQPSLDLGHPAAAGLGRSQASSKLPRTCVLYATHFRTASSFCVAEVVPDEMRWSKEGFRGAGTGAGGWRTGLRCKWGKGNGKGHHYQASLLSITQMLSTRWISRTEGRQQKHNAIDGLLWATDSITFNRLNQRTCPNTSYLAMIFKRERCTEAKLNLVFFSRFNFCHTLSHNSQGYKISG